MRLSMAQWSGPNLTLQWRRKEERRAARSFSCSDEELHGRILITADLTRLRDGAARRHGAAQRHGEATQDVSGVLNKYSQP